MRRLRRSFPLRVALVAAAIQAGLILLILAVAYGGAAWLMARSLDRQLLVTARQLGGGEAGHRPPGIPMDKVLARRALEEGAAFATYRLPDHQDGDERESHEREERGGTSPGRAVPPAIPEADWQRILAPDWLLALRPDEEAVRVAYVRVDAASGRRVIPVAGSAGATAEELRELAVGLGGLATAGAMATAALVFWLSHRAFQPLREITATLAAVEPRALHTRLTPEVPDATVERLVGVINDLLARLEKAFQAQVRFAANAAHELRSPLGALRADLEVALRRPRTASEYRHTLMGALEEVGRLSRLSDDLLVLAWQDGTRPLPLEDEVVVASLVRRVQRELAPMAEETGVDLLTDVPPDLRLTCDRLAVERMLTNLIRNALQHTPAGGRVQVTARQTFKARAEQSGPEAGVELEVVDTGTGIPPEHLEHIFSPFYRVDAARRRGGTGLGLAIVSTIAEAHGGTVAVSSVPGAGTRFVVWLPLRPHPRTRS